MQKNAHECAADAADDMCQLRNVVLRKDACKDFLGQVKGTDGDEGDGNLTVSFSGGGGEENQHENDAAGTHQCGISAENQMKNGGDKGRDGEHDEHPDASETFLHDGPQGEDERHIGHVVREIRVAENIGKQAENEQRRHGGTIDGKDQTVGYAVGELAQQQCDKGNKRKADHQRRIERKDDLPFLHGETFSQYFSCRVYHFRNGHSSFLCARPAVRLLDLTVFRPGTGIPLWTVHNFRKGNALKREKCAG